MRGESAQALQVACRLAAAPRRTACLPPALNLTGAVPVLPCANTLTALPYSPEAGAFTAARSMMPACCTWPRALVAVRRCLPPPRWAPRWAAAPRSQTLLMSRSCWRASACCRLRPAHRQPWPARAAAVAHAACRQTESTACSGCSPAVRLGLSLQDKTSVLCCPAAVQQMKRRRSSMRPPCTLGDGALRPLPMCFSRPVIH